MRLCGGIQAIGLVSLIRLKKVNSDGSMEVTPSTLIGTVMVDIGHPNDHNGNEDCTEITSEGGWNDNNCDYPKKFICRRYDQVA